MTIPQHSSRSNEHYTPVEVVSAVHSIMGGIDLDPASCALANQNVRASRFFTKEDDGLSRPWEGRVLLNPPGSKRKGESMASLFWNKLTTEYEEGRVHSAFFVGFNSNVIFMSQSGRCVLDYPVCFPRKRMQFLAPDRSGKLSPQGSPTHHNVLAFLPPRDDLTNALHRFWYYTKDLGWVGRATPFRAEQFEVPAVE